MKTTFQTFEDQYRFKLLTDSGEVIGNLSASVIYDPYDYDFDHIISESKFNKFITNCCVIKIEDLTVFEDYRGKGGAKMLLKHALEVFEYDGYPETYLNACPMGVSNILPLKPLVNLYKSFGFRKIIDQGRNVMMIRTIN